MNGMCPMCNDKSTNVILKADGRVWILCSVFCAVSAYKRQFPKRDVASMIDVLVGAGANDIGGINFMVSQASKLLDEAREQAIADARRKAQIYAKAAGVTLGEPLSISEEGSPTPVFRGKVAGGMAATAAPVAQGEETLSVTVNVSWAIKPKE